MQLGLMLWQVLLTASDGLINAELVKIQALFTGLGLTYARSQVTTNISSSKITK